MFIFRSFAYIFAVLGYIFAGVIIYLGFNPVAFPKQQDLELKTLINCNTRSQSFRANDLDNTQVSSLKTELGKDAPVELVKDLVDTIDSVVSTIGAVSELTIDYCDVQNRNNLITQINTSLDPQKKYYEFGTVEQFVDSFNQLPFAKLTNFRVEVASTFVRSTTCNKPINNTDLYLFTVFNTPTINNSRVILFKIEVQPKDNLSLQERLINNIIQSGHYFKSTLNCNG